MMVVVVVVVVVAAVDGTSKCIGPQARPTSTHMYSCRSLGVVIISSLVLLLLHSLDHNQLPSLHTHVLIVTI